MSGRPGARRRDAVELGGVDLPGAISSLADGARTMADDLDTVQAVTASTAALGTTDKDRARAALRHAATGRDAQADWTRVLAEVAVLKVGLSQREVAAALDVSTQTINRWVNNPIVDPGAKP